MTNTSLLEGFINAPMLQTSMKNPQSMLMDWPCIHELSCWEAIRPGTFYAWTKELTEAGKERLSRDTIRDATRQEMESLANEIGSHVFALIQISV